MTNNANGSVAGQHQVHVNPESGSGAEEITDAVNYLLEQALMDAECALADLQALADAIRSQPGSLIEMARERRHQRILEHYCADADECENVARVAAELQAEDDAARSAAAVQVPTGPGALKV